MDFGQTIRRQWRDFQARLAGFGARRRSAAPRPSEPNPDAPRPDHRWGLIARAALIVMLVLVVVFPLTAWFYSHIDDDPAFAAPSGTVRAGQSQAVANAVALIDLEVNQRDWAANDPWFWPTSLLDNMPNYQKGVMQAMGRFAFELTDQIGRARGSSEADKDLQNAAGLLQYPPDVWVWSPSVSFWPTATSESQYRKAMKALKTYNERLAGGNAVFDTRADNLKFTLDRMAADIGSSSSVIDQHIRKTSGFPFQNDTDDIFYTTKGQMYGYYIVLKGHGEGFRRRHQAARSHRALGQHDVELPRRHRAQAQCRAQRRARQQFRALQSVRRRLLPPARPHPIARNHQHPAAIAGLVRLGRSPRAGHERPSQTGCHPPHMRGTQLMPSHPLPG